MKEIHPELLRYPVMAVRCALRGIESSSAPGAGWSDASTEFVENLCGDDVIRCTFLGPKLPDGAMPVDLIVNGKNVAEELCRAGHARTQGTTPRDGIGRRNHNAMVSPSARSHVNQPGES